MLGQLIHNEAVTQKLLSLGAKYVECLDDVPDGASVIVRAHGVPKATYDEIAKRGLNIVDVTCPFVRKIHQIVEEESRAGRLVLILGDPMHPEVIGIRGWCNNAVVLKDIDELEEYLAKNCKGLSKTVSLVAQTTSNRTKWEFFVNNSKKVYTNLKIFDTICNATDERQSECAQIASESEVMLVIGDGNSSNTRKLGGSCRSQLCESVSYRRCAGAQ